MTENLVINSLKNELEEMGVGCVECGPNSITVLKRYTPPHGFEMTHTICTIYHCDNCVRVIPRAFDIDCAEPGTFERLFDIVKTLNEMIKVAAQFQTEQITHSFPFSIEYRQTPKTNLGDYVYLNDEEFEFHGLLDLLRALGDGSIQVNDGAKSLKALGIIKSEGSRRSGIGATYGPNGKSLIEELEKHEEKLFG